MFQQMFQTVSKYKAGIITAIVAIFFIGSAAAGADATAFDSIWDEVSLWAMNAPGKIVAFLTFGVAVFMGVVQQNYVAAVGAFFASMLIANAQSIIENFLTAGIELATVTAPVLQNAL
jgi:hypothetical protein